MRDQELEKDRVDEYLDPALPETNKKELIYWLTYLIHMLCKLIKFFFPLHKSFWVGLFVIAIEGILISIDA